MKRIHQLSRQLINQIAAGEVIERPASVVKELVENSLDAGATKIEVEVSKDCLSIRVSDNGSGIHPDDIELAFLKHATSKIEKSEDLFDIHTMGFRGEALASIISIAKVTCKTRTKDNETGTQVECEVVLQHTRPPEVFEIRKNRTCRNCRNFAEYCHSKPECFNHSCKRR